MLIGHGDLSLLFLSLTFRARAFRPRKIIRGFRTLLEPSGPTPEYFFHPRRLDAELRHRDAAIDGLAILRDQPIAHEKAAHAVDHHAPALELRNRRRKTRQRPDIALTPVEHRIEHFPAIIGGIAVKQVRHHMRDVGAASMRAVDVVVIDSVFSKMVGEARAITCLRRQREITEERCKLVAGHVASHSPAGIRRLQAATLSHPKILKDVRTHGKIPRDGYSAASSMIARGAHAIQPATKFFNHDRSVTSCTARPSKCR